MIRLRCRAASFEPATSAATFCSSIDLPVDVVLDIGMVGVDDHHLGGAPCRAARFDRAGGAVADLEEAHQPRGAPAARQPLAVAAQLREIGAGARAVFEEPRLAHPEIHDAALVDEIVGDRLDEAGVRLRVLVGAFRGTHLAGAVIDVIVALRRPIDAVGPVEPGVEPLRAVGRAHLARQHHAQFVVEGAGILLAIEIAAFPAPIGPGAGEPVEALLGAGLGAAALGLRAARASAAASGMRRHSQSGTPSSSIAASRAGTPALRRYFWARMSQATWLHSAGTSIPSAANTTEPSGLRISLRRAAEGDGLVRVAAGRGKTTRDMHITPPTSHILWPSAPFISDMRSAPNRHKCTT